MTGAATVRGYARKWLQCLTDVGGRFAMTATPLLRYQIQ